MRRAGAVRLVVVTAAVGAGTIVLGWWTVPVIGALHGLVTPSRWRVPEAAIGAGAAWSLLLLWNATQGPVMQLANQVGRIFMVSGAVLIAGTVAFAMLLAASAAELTGALLDRR